jgi:hypothetical protein
VLHCGAETSKRLTSSVQAINVTVNRPAIAVRDNHPMVCDVLSGATRELISRLNNLSVMLEKRHDIFYSTINVVKMMRTCNPASYIIKSAIDQPQKGLGVYIKHMPILSITLATRRQAQAVLWMDRS